MGKGVADPRDLLLRYSSRELTSLVRRHQDTRCRGWSVRNGHRPNPPRPCPRGAITHVCWKHCGASQLQGTPLARSVTKQPLGAVCWGDRTAGTQTGISRSIGVSRCVYRCWQWLCHQLPLQHPSPLLGRTYLNALAGIARFPPIIPGEAAVPTP